MFTDGLSKPADLVSDDVIERITFLNKDRLPLDGNFAAPPGTPFDQLSLPPDRLNGSTIRLNYRVLRPLPDGVQMGEIAPGFEQRGGGTQYYFPGGLERLVKLGYIEEIK